MHMASVHCAFEGPYMVAILCEPATLNGRSCTLYYSHNHTNYLHLWHSIDDYLVKVWGNIIAIKVTLLLYLVGCHVAITLFLNAAWLTLKTTVTAAATIRILVRCTLWIIS